MKQMLIGLSLISSLVGYTQSLERLSIKGAYSQSDSTQIVRAYLLAKEAVGLMNKEMLDIKNVKTNEELRVKMWSDSKAFSKWLGTSERMGVSFRRISKIHSKFNKRITFQVIKKNKGRCKGWISAWTLPYGHIKIRLCEDFFMYRTHLQEKVIVHEIGHETGLLSHHKIHGCRAALRAASNNSNLAKRSTENYAWLAMSYLDLACSYR